MSLTKGWGPFGPRAAGTFNFDLRRPDRILYFEDSPRLVRVTFHGQTIAESDAVKLLHETDHLPVYYFPAEHVRAEFLERTDRHTFCPLKGDAAYWSVRVGDRVAENAAWAYPEPLPGAEFLADYVAFYWNAMDAWFEEEEQIFVHPRDPYHRVDVLHSSRHIRVSVQGETVAETDEPVLLFETSLPTRYYFTADEVRMDHLVPSDTRTACPYKGETTGYWSIRTDDHFIADAAWSYGEPMAAVAAIAGRIAFYNHKVTIEVDGRVDPG